MKRKGFLRLSLLVATLLVGTKLHAADKGAQFGVIWGLSVPDADNTNPFKLLGVNGQAFVLPQVSLGGYYFQSDRSGQISTANKFCYNLTGIEISYHMAAAQGDTFFGVRMGMTKIQANPSLTDVTFSPYHYGIATGYDYYLTSMFSLGFEGSYLHVMPGRTVQNGTTFEEPSFNIISFLLSFKVRL